MNAILKSENGVVIGVEEFWLQWIGLRHIHTAALWKGHMAQFGEPWVYNGGENDLNWQYALAWAKKYPFKMKYSDMGNDVYSRTLTDQEVIDSFHS